MPYVSSGSSSLTAALNHSKTRRCVIPLTNRNPSPLLWLRFRGNGMTLSQQLGDGPRSLPRCLVLMLSFKCIQSRGLLGRKKACVKRQMVSNDVRGSLKRCGTIITYFQLKTYHYSKYICPFHSKKEIRETRQKYGFYLLFFLFLKTVVKNAGVQSTSEHLCFTCQQTAKVDLEI